jgi:hypothetical protein
MLKKQKQRASQVPYGRPLHFNIVSGIIYTTAAAATVALGSMFLKAYFQAQRDMGKLEPAIRAASAEIPPRATIVAISHETNKAPVKQAKPQAEVEAQPSPPTDTRPAAPVAATASPEPTNATPVEMTEGDMPSIRPIPPKPWTGGTVVRTNFRPARLYPTADTCVPIDPIGSKEINLGAASKLSLKGNESIILARYDFNQIRGWTIDKVTWHGKLMHGQARALGFSALTADWEEGKGTLKAPSIGGATYRWADFKKKPWREKHTPVTHLIRGNGRSLVAYAPLPKVIAEEGQWVSVEVDPIVVQALVAGAANTIAITDEKGQVGVPAIMASREDTNNCHYFEVEGGVVDIAAAGPITDLKAFAHPALRRRNTVGILLTWIAPGDDGNTGQAFLYEVRYAPGSTTFENAVSLPPYKIPWPQPQGQKDQMIIENLEPDTQYTFFIRARDEAGQAGPVSEVSLKTPPRVAYPEVPAPDSYESAPIDIAVNAPSLRVMDETVGVDPISGALKDSPSPGQKVPAEMSSLWDSGARTIHLRAAQNETIGFCIALMQKSGDFPKFTFNVQDFQGPKAVIPGRQLQIYQTWYAPSTSPRTGLKWVGDALVALENTLSLQSLGNTVPGQTAQSVYAELHVPTDAEQGTYRSQVILTRDNGAESKLDVTLDILAIRLPDQPRFTIELPAPFSIAMQYYLKDLANLNDATPIELLYQRLARDHRCALAFVPYARNGTFSEFVVPQTYGKGANFFVTSWTDWDRRFMSYLTGAAFSGADRSRAPISHFVLPIFENWPTPLADGYLCAPEEIIGTNGLSIFAGASDGIYSCMNSDYWRAFRSALKQFARHFKTSNGENTTAQLWLNNGPIAHYSGKAPPWSLGYPLYRDDFLALEAFAQASSSASDSFPSNRFAFRVNVPDVASLAQYGIHGFSLLSAADMSPPAWRLLRDRAALTGETLWMQMNTLPLENNRAEIETIGLKHFLEGADGWTISEVVGRAEHLKHAQPQSLFYCGLPLNIEGPLPSLRLKALRRVQQDIEYLLLLQEKMKWTRDQLADYVYQIVPRLEESPAISSDEIYRLRFAVQEALKNP